MCHFVVHAAPASRSACCSSSDSSQPHVHRILKRLRLRSSPMCLGCYRLPKNQPPRSYRQIRHPHRTLQLSQVRRPQSKKQRQRQPLIRSAVCRCGRRLPSCSFLLQPRPSFLELKSSQPTVNSGALVCSALPTQELRKPSIRCRTHRLSRCSSLLMKKAGRFNGWARCSGRFPPQPRMLD